MQIVTAEGPSGPSADSAATVKTLISHVTEGGQMSVTEVVIPPGGEVREHDHGGSEALFVPIDGQLTLFSGNQREDITIGMVARVDRGERVGLVNQTHKPVMMIVVFASAIEPTEPDGDADHMTESPGAGVTWMGVPPTVVEQLKDETAVHVDLAGHPICLARSGGTIYAMLDECSHGHVELSEGDVEDGHVECWLHGSRFDLASGVPACLPATEPVPVYPVRIGDRGVEVALPSSTAT